MNKKIVNCLVICLSSLLLASTVMAQPYSARQQSLVERFNNYAHLGLIYDIQADQLAWQGSPVKLFVIYKYDMFGNKTEELDFSWFDAKSYSTLYLEAAWGAYGLLEIRRMDLEAAQAMAAILQQTQPAGDFSAPTVPSLPDQASAADSPGNSPVTPFSPSLDFNAMQGLDSQPDWNVAPVQESPAVTGQGRYILNGSQHILSLGIHAADLDKASASPEINAWMAICDARPGAYVRKIRMADGSFELYIYYNAGGRYPWRVNANVNAINFYLYTRGEQVTTEGYQLLRCVCRQDIPILDLFVDEVPLQYALTELSH